MKRYIYIYGMGRNGKVLLNQLEKMDVKIEAFIDRNKMKNPEDYPACISIEEAIKRGATDNIILISCNKDYEIKPILKEKGFKYVYCVSKWIRKNKYFNPQRFTESDFDKAVPFNHYESPYSDIIEIHNDEQELFNKHKKVMDIDLNINCQFELIKKMETIKLPTWGSEKDERLQYRYYYNNNWFSRGCAELLSFMINILNPSNIVEVGSGFSTAVMLDTNDQFFQNKIKINSIEPNAQRLKGLLKSTDNIKIYEKKLQQTPPEFFDKLGENDILFIDSSHISKINSDVNYLFFDILPRLKNGVYIHFHDVFYPFIYPKEWIYEGRAYNEMYILRAFLMNNQTYSIQFWGDMLDTLYPERMPERLRGCGIGSIWIKKG